MATTEDILEIFRRFDDRGDGRITRMQLVQVFKQLDSSRWVDSNIDLVLENSGLSRNMGEDDLISYEDLVVWAMTGATCNSDDKLLRTKASSACQAAFDGALDTLRGLLKANGMEAASQAGFVEVDGTLAGLWTMGLVGFNAFELRSLASEPGLQPASPLQYAAFSGKADVVRFLLEECSMSKDDEGRLGTTATDIARCHRVGLDGEAMLDGGEALEALLEDEAPLPLQSLERTLTRTMKRCVPADSAGVPTAAT